MHKDMMKSLIGKVIKLDRGGPNSKIGKLLDVSDDFLVLLTEDDGVMYFYSHHIKSVTENTKEPLKFKVEVPEGFEYKKADHFYGLLDSLKYQWVKINHAGPEKIEGVLNDIHKDFVTLINKEEIVRLNMYHIRNISYGLKIEQGEEEKSEETETQTQSKWSDSENQSFRQRIVRSENNQFQK